MRRPAEGVLGSTLALFIAAGGLVGQELTEICPGAEDGTGALWGAVTDDGTALPGATVDATWEADGSEQSTQVQVGLDGSYTICYLPLETAITVQPMFSAIAGTAVEVTLSEIFVRQDMTLSMSGGISTEGGEDDDRIWLCIAGGESTINIQYSRLIRCDTRWQPLARCPKEELGRVSATPSGSGRNVLREMIEALVNEAKRLGANAIINVDERMVAAADPDRVETGPSPITGEAVLISVDPLTC